MNFNQLLAFYEVARQRSFTRAAQRLSISQPAVTRRILEMERAHDVKLLERTSRNVILTEPGKVLMSYVERMVALADEADVTLDPSPDSKPGASKSARAGRSPTLICLRSQWHSNTDFPESCPSYTSAIHSGYSNKYWAYV